MTEIRVKERKAPDLDIEDDKNNGIDESKQDDGGESHNNEGKTD